MGKGQRDRVVRWQWEGLPVPRGPGPGLVGGSHALLEAEEQLELSVVGDLASECLRRALFQQEELHGNWTKIRHALPVGVQTAVGKLTEECSTAVQNLRNW